MRGARPAILAAAAVMAVVAVGCGGSQQLDVGKGERLIACQGWGRGSG